MKEAPRITRMIADEIESGHLGVICGLIPEDKQWQR